MDNFKRWVIPGEGSFSQKLADGVSPGTELLKNK